jgi:foldase protein PrsA
MRNRVRRFTALGAFFVVAVAVAACGSTVPGDAVVNVDGNPITTRAFDHWMYVAAKSQASQNPGAPIIVPSDPPNFAHCIAQVKAEVPTLAKASTTTLRSDCKQLFTTLSSQVLDFLIKGYWYQAEAAKEHITVTNAQVQKAFETAKKQQFPTAAGFNQFLSQTGQTLQDILFRFRVNQVFTKLLAKHTTKVTPAAIAAFYNAHQSQFGTPEQRNIRIVLTKTKAGADAAKAALSHGGNWKVVAKKYSIDPTSKNNGGLLINVRKGQEDQALDTAAFSTTTVTNKVYGPVKGQFGYYVFEVTKVTQPTQQTLAQATPLIKQTLTSQQQSTSQTALDTLVKKHWLGQTNCQSAFAMIDCSNYTPPKSTTGLSGPTAPAPSTTPTVTTSSSPTTTSGTTTTTK